MPAEFQILSLPPQFRSKLQFMLLVLLIPATLKPLQQKKYFDYLSEELNYLATVGLRCGPRGTIKAQVFGITLDLPGRDKFLSLRGYNSVHGCPDCLLEYVSKWKLMYLGSRRQLPPESPLRGRRCGDYQFIDEEPRPAAPLRTTALMHDCLQVLFHVLLHYCRCSQPCIAY